jgi:dipeptidyl aminopeptidase/acylaminoacyl peptidase
LSADANQVEPELSPDGTSIVFQGKSLPSTDEQSNQLFILEADGTVRQLTDGPGGATSPSWSPDGSQIAFVKSPEGDIFVVDVDGTDMRAVTATPADDRLPDWSPDGSHIVFESGSEDVAGIWIVSVDDGSLMQLTFPGGAANPAWSPDGSWIAFRGDDGKQVSELERNDHDIWIIHPDGTGLHRLVPGENETFEWGDESPDGHYQGDLDWSPSGGSIAFTEVHCDCIHIFDVATGEETELEMDIGNGSLENVSWGQDGSILLAVNLYD